MTIARNSGLIADQDQNVSAGDPITFVVTEFDDGELTCEITEQNLSGYSSSYFNGSVTNQTSCNYNTLIGRDDFECRISNELNPVEVEVTKDWMDEHPQFNNSTHARAKASCDNEWALQDRNLHFQDDGDKDSFWVWPSYTGNTECDVSERIRDSGVETDASDCQDIEVALGDTKLTCTIVNTRIYEGVPTLSQYGLALLALLMLGLGMVGFRRFA